MERRNTKRKDIIRRLLSQRFEEQTDLLDELLWTTFVEEKMSKNEDSSLLHRSYRISFLRTLRDHIPELIVHKRAPLHTPIGIIARAAVFRIKHRRLVERFLSARDTCIVMNRGVVDIRDSTGLYKSIWGYFIRCRFYKGRPYAPSDSRYGSNYLARVCLPLTVPISIVCQTIGDDIDFVRLEGCPWSILWIRRERSIHNARIVRPEVILKVLMDRDRQVWGTIGDQDI